MQKLFIDFKGFVVIDFDDNDEYVFLEYEKIKKIEDLLKIVKFEHFEKQIENQKIQEVTEKNFKQYVTFYINNRNLLKQTPIHLKILKEDPCSKSVIYAQIKKNDSKFQHYVNKYDDVWICKEMMHQIVNQHEWILKFEREEAFKNLYKLPKYDSHTKKSITKHDGEKDEFTEITKEDM